MKINELIEQLQVMKRQLNDPNGETEVHFAYQYGDYWRTMVGPRVEEIMSEEVVWSEYHQMHRILGDREHDEWVDALSAEADEDRAAAEDLSTELGRRIAEKTPKLVVVIR